MLFHPNTRLSVVILALAVALGACSVPSDQAGVGTQEAEHQITLEVQGPGQLIFDRPPGSCRSVCTVTAPLGETLEISPVPDSGMEFAGWQGACSGPGDCSLQVDGDARVEAAFASPVEPPPTSDPPPGAEDPNDDESGEDSGGGGTGDDGTAGDDQPSGDDDTTGDDSTGDGGPATDGEDSHTLKLGADGDAEGTVSAAPGELECHGRRTTCWQDFPAGSQMTIRAEPDSGAIFSYWSLDVESGSTDVPCRDGAHEPTCELVLDEDIFILAVFLTGEDVHRLRVHPRATRGGQVTGPGLECGSGLSDCHEFYRGTVTIIADPAQSFELDHWEGDCAGSSEECQVTMNGDREVSAVFRERTEPEGEVATLNVVPSTYYTGKVVVEPGGFECNDPQFDDCEHDFPTGTRVTLEAIPDSGNVFAHWSEDGGPYDPVTDAPICDGDDREPVCRFTINWDMTVHATFYDESE